MIILTRGLKRFGENKDLHGPVTDIQKKNVVMSFYNSSSNGIQLISKPAIC